MIELVGDVIEVEALEVAKWTKVMNGQWEIQPAQPRVSQQHTVNIHVAINFKGAIIKKNYVRPN